MVDVDVGHRLDHGPRARRTAGRVGGVDLAEASTRAGGQLGDGVPGDAHHGGVLVVGGDVHQHGGVGVAVAGAVLQAAADHSAVLARPGVRAHDQHVHGALPGRVRARRLHTARVRRGRDALDVAVELEVDPGTGPADQYQERGRGICRDHQYFVTTAVGKAASPLDLALVRSRRCADPARHRLTSESLRYPLSVYNVTLLGFRTYVGMIWLSQEDVNLLLTFLRKCSGG